MWQGVLVPQLKSKPCCRVACCCAAAQVTPLVIDDSLVAMCQTIADVKGWSMQQAADRLLENFRAFYEGQL